MTIDPASVVKSGEVFLDGKRYPLIGGQRVTKSVASETPARRSSGVLTPADHPFISSITWSDFTGGEGLAAITSDADFTRTTQLDRFQPTVRGRLSSVPKKTATSTSGANGTPGAIAELNASVYVNWHGANDGSNVYRYDSTNDRWGNTAGSSTAAVVGLTQAATDAGTGFVNSTEYMVFVTGTDMEWRPGDDTSWAGPDTTNITYTTFFNNRLWGIHTDGRFYMTTQLSTSGTDAGWVELGKLTLPGGSGLVTDLLSGPTPDVNTDRIYAATEIGLWVYENENETWNHVFRRPYKQHSGKGTAVHRNGIFFTSGFELFPFIPSAERTFIGEISPNFDGGTLVSRIGTFRKVLTRGTELSAFVSFDTGSTFQGGIYNWSERTGWYRSERTQGSTTETTEHALVSNAYSSQRMWYSNSTNSTGGKVYFTPLPTSVEPSYRGTLTPYQNSSMLVQFPSFDAGGSLQAKLAVRAHVVVSQMDQVAGTLAVGYKINTGGTVKTLGLVNSTGASVFNFPDSTSNPVGAEFNSIQLQLLGQSSTATPLVIDEFTFEYVRRNPTLFQYDIPIDLRASQRYNDRGTRAMRADIDALLNSTAMVEFRYTDDDSTEERIYVLPQRLISQDETGRLEKSETILRVTQLIRDPSTNQQAAPLDNDGFFFEDSTTSFLILEGVDKFFVIQE